MQDLKIALIQTSLEWEDKDKNFEKFEKLISEIEDGVSLIILPEMFSTGFSMNTRELAELTDGKTLEWMSKMASAIQAVVTGSFIVKENNRFYNRLVWMQPDGNYDYYDKRHLFSMAGEEDYFEPGNTRKLFEIDGWKICPMICYDLRFPVWVRNTISYDLLLFVANWPEKRVSHWTTLLKARAIENQCYVAGVNRIGEDGNGINHTGESAVYSPTGEALAGTSHKEEILYATLSKKDLEINRRYMPFLQDMDDFSI